MSQILVSGCVPPPLITNAKIEAAHYRTWQLLEPLLSDGHSVRLLCGQHGERLTLKPPPAHWPRSLEIVPTAFGEPGWMAAQQREHDSFKPDCVVAVNFSHTLYATKLRTQAPIWMDLYGDQATIMQAAAYRAGSDRGIETVLGFVADVLKTGDVFSTCGLPQKHALIGQLSMIGRLTRHAFGYEFAHPIQPGAPPRREPVARGVKRQLLSPSQTGIADDDWVLLWCGGYNTWTDVDTLFQALEHAMARTPKLHYVSVGANTYEAPNNVYARLGAMIERSPHRARYHLLGWRPWQEIAGFYRESDAGINIDAFHYETLYGTRTRLVDMIGAGLPVITTLGPELAEILAAENAALTFKIGDWRGLVDHIVTLAGDRAQTQAMSAAAQACAAGRLSFDATTQVLRDWVRAPQAAPDKLHRATLRPADRMDPFKNRARSRLRRLLWHTRASDR